MLRKKKEKKTEQSEIIETTQQENPVGSPLDEMADVSTIEEFIEIKKLQNRLLKKMLNNINQTDKLDN